MFLWFGDILDFVASGYELGFMVGPEQDYMFGVL